MRWIWLAVVTTVTALLGCDPAARDIPCLESANCDRFPGGVCRTAPSGNQWCSYPDSACESGYRYSDLDVGDGVSGACAEKTFRLTVSVGGDGAGVVSSMAGELVCEAGICTGTFVEGARVELAATARAGAFVGWLQSCQGTGDCGVVMDRDRSVSALFGTPGHALWVQQVGGSGSDHSGDVAVDGDGNVIAVGTFFDSLQTGGITLTSAGDNDIFVIKLNGLTGDVIWARHFGGLRAESGSLVRTDASNNVYVVGDFWGIVDLGGGKLEPEGAGDVFVLKLTADGDHVWSRSFGGTLVDVAYDLAVRVDTIAIAGSYDSPSMTIGNSTLTHAGMTYADGYVATMTTDGEFVWGRSLGSVGRDYGFGVALDSSRNVVVVGEFSGAMNLGGGTLLATDKDAFVAKYARPSGAHLLSRQYGGTGRQSARTVSIDPMDNIIVAGVFAGTSDFGGPVPLVAANGAVFVAKYALAGAYLWAKSFSATGATGFEDENASSVAVDGRGDVTLAGTFCGTISFGGAPMSSGSDCLTFNYDIFAVKLATSDGGHVSSVRSGGGSGGGSPTAIRIAPAANGQAFLVGEFAGYVELGGRGLTANGTDAFILALAPL